MTLEEVGRRRRNRCFSGGDDGFGGGVGGLSHTFQTQVNRFRMADGIQVSFVYQVVDALNVTQPIFG